MFNDTKPAQGMDKLSSKLCLHKNMVLKLYAL